MSGFFSLPIFRKVLAVGGYVFAALLCAFVLYSCTALPFMMATPINSATRLEYVNQRIVAYRSDHSLQAPPSLDVLVPRYLSEGHLQTNGIYLFNLPFLHFGKVHAASSLVRVSTSGVATDEGGLLYDSTRGRAYVNCTHTDRQGNALMPW